MPFSIYIYSGYLDIENIQIDEILNDDILFVIMTMKQGNNIVSFANNRIRSIYKISRMCVHFRYIDDIRYYSIYILRPFLPNL